MPWIGGDDRSAGIWYPEPGDANAITGGSAYNNPYSQGQLSTGYTAMQNLVNQGWNPTAAAGVAGSFGVETDNYRYGIQGGPGGGYGVGRGYGQWELPGSSGQGSGRGTGFVAGYPYAMDQTAGRRNFMDPTYNMDYFSNEFNNSSLYGRPNWGGSVFFAEDPASAARAFTGTAGQSGYLRPAAGSEHFDRRGDQADAYYNYWASQQNPAYGNGNYYGDYYTPSSDIYRGAGGYWSGGSDTSAGTWVPQAQSSYGGYPTSGGYGGGNGSFGDFGMGASTGGYGSGGSFWADPQYSALTPSAYNTLNFTVGGPSAEGGHWVGGNDTSAGTWVSDAPSAASLNGFGSGGGYGSDFSNMAASANNSLAAFGAANTYAAAQNQASSDALNTYYAAVAANAAAAGQNAFNASAPGQIQGYNPYSTQYQSY